jgi:hypothetical protein
VQEGARLDKQAEWQRREWACCISPEIAPSPASAALIAQGTQWPSPGGCMARGPRGQGQGQGQGPERGRRLQEDQRGPKSEYAIFTTHSGPLQNNNTLQRPSYGGAGQTTDQGGRESRHNSRLPAMQRKTARNAAVLMVVVMMARERDISCKVGWV